MIENVLAVKSHAIKKVVISVKPMKWETTDTDSAANFISFLEEMGFEVTTKIEESNVEILDVKPA